MKKRVTWRDARRVQDRAPYIAPFTSENDLTERKLVIEPGSAKKKRSILRHETINPNIRQNLTSKNFKTTKQAKTKEQPNHRGAQL